MTFSCHAALCDISQEYILDLLNEYIVIQKERKRIHSNIHQAMEEHLRYPFLSFANSSLLNHHLFQKLKLIGLKEFMYISENPWNLS